MKKSLIFLITLIILVLLIASNVFAANAGSFVINYNYKEIENGQKWVSGSQKFSSDYGGARKKTLNAVITGTLIKDQNSKDFSRYYFEDAILSWDYYSHYTYGDVGDICATKNVDSGSGTIDLGYKGKKWPKGNEEVQADNLVSIDRENNKYYVSINNFNALSLLNPGEPDDCYVGGSDADDCPNLVFKPVERKYIATGPTAFKTIYGEDRTCPWATPSIPMPSHQAPPGVIFSFEDDLRDMNTLSGSKVDNKQNKEAGFYANSGSFKEESISWTFDLPDSNQNNNPDQIPALPGEDERAAAQADADYYNSIIPLEPIVHNDPTIIATQFSDSSSDQGSSSSLPSDLSGLDISGEINSESDPNSKNSPPPSDIPDSDLSKLDISSTSSDLTSTKLIMRFLPNHNISNPSFLISYFKNDNDFNQGKNSYLTSVSQRSKSPSSIQNLVISPAAKAAISKAARNSIKDIFLNTKNNKGLITGIFQITPSEELEQAINDSTIVFLFPLKQLGITADQLKDVNIYVWKVEDNGIKTKVQAESKLNDARDTLIIKIHINKFSYFIVTAEPKDQANNPLPVSNNSTPKYSLTIYLIVGIVILAVVLFFVFRKKK